VDEEFIGHAIIGPAIKVHSIVGPGLLESAYETCLHHELETQGAAFELYQTRRVQAGLFVKLSRPAYARRDRQDGQWIVILSGRREPFASFAVNRLSGASTVARREE
jgi:hypothetical protein